jgi:small subunit ribosomal protein S8
MSKEIFNLYSSINQSIIHQKSSVKIIANKRLDTFLKLLLQEGFISDFEIISNDANTYYKFNLIYDKVGVNVLQYIYPISKASRRIFINLNTLQKINKLHVILVISTNLGLMTSTEALKKNQGGEIICLLL